MKRTLAMIFMLILLMSALCGCQKEAEMVEDMVSTVFTDVDNMVDNGIVKDNDGYIGNEDNKNDSSQKDDSTLMRNDDVM